MKSFRRPPDKPTPGAVQGVNFPARVAFTTKEHGAYLVDLTGDGMSVVQDGDGLFLVIRAPIVALDQVAASMIEDARSGRDVKGLIRPGGAT